jgi:hypothetical protein
VYEKAVHIIEAYFGGEDVEDENMTPAVTASNTFSFGAPAAGALDFTKFSAPQQQLSQGNQWQVQTQPKFNF